MGDAHILPKEKDFQIRFSKFLRSRGGAYDYLFIMGDLFEFWFGFDGYRFQNEYGEVLNALSELASHGTQIIYLEGNHDFNMGPVFSRDLLARVYTDWARFDVDHRRWFVTHGDLASARGFRYGTYRKLIKNPLTYDLIRLMGPRIILKMAEKMAFLSHQVYHAPKAYDAERYMGYVRDQFLKGYDVVIMGHTHRATIKEYQIGRRSCLYVNCGDIKKKETYVTYHTGEGFRIERGI